ITGGASGLGRATALRLAQEGAVVVVADVDDAGGEAVARDVGGHYIHTDVSDLDANKAAVAFAIQQAGGVDLAYLNAGVTSGCGIGEDFDLTRYRRAMGINLDGVVFGAHAVSEAMRTSQTQGAIVATASLAGLMGIPMDPIYSVNKHGVVGLTRAIGPVLAQHGIRFNAVCPGFADTAILEGAHDELTSQGFPIMTAEEVADVVVELFTNDATGECWFVQLNNHGPFRFSGIPGPRPAPTT
ncbi:MAG TPA: SDR family NAD(P)-dependent oxidoreductase, partial [Solirubrobacteraceae bacterium]